MQQEHQQNAMNGKMGGKPYAMLALNLAISLLIMYLAMFAMIWSFGEFFNNSNFYYAADARPAQGSRLFRQTS